MNNNYYETISYCRKLLDLPEKASIELIEKKYKDALKKWHPDVCNQNKEICEEMTKEIIMAGKILLEYCYKYPIDFSEHEIENNLSPEDFWKKKFGEDNNWDKK